MNIVDECTCAGCGASRPKEPGPCPSCGDTRRQLSATASCEVKVTASEVGLGVKRGPGSWNYFYIVMGVLIAFLGWIVGFLDALGWAEAIVFGSLFIAIVVSILGDRRVHNLLLRFKSSYEDNVRY